MKKVTVITPCFNSEKTLQDTLLSVSNQTYINIEHILIDGLSNDSSFRVATKFNHKKTFILTSKSDDGMYDAVNTGINMATGDLITILNSDDVYSNNNIIAEIVQQFEKFPAADILFGDIVLVDQNDLKKIKRYYSPRRFKPWKLRFGWMPPHPGSFVKREVYTQYGLYSQDYKIAADYEMFIRLLLINRLKYVYFKKILVLMRLGGLSTGGISSNILLNREIVKACRSNGIYTNIALLIFKIPFKLLECFNIPRL